MLPRLTVEDALLPLKPFAGAIKPVRVGGISRDRDKTTPF